MLNHLKGTPARERPKRRVPSAAGGRPSDLFTVRVRVRVCVSNFGSMLPQSRRPRFSRVIDRRSPEGPGPGQPRRPSPRRAQLRACVLGGFKQETMQNFLPPVWAAFSAFRAICVPNVAHLRPNPGGVDQPRRPSSHRGQLRAGILGGRKQEITQNFSPPAWAALSAFRVICVPNVAICVPRFENAIGVRREPCGTVCKSAPFRP